jgi:hypothetical protein
MVSNPRQGIKLLLNGITLFQIMLWRKNYCCLYAPKPKEEELVHVVVVETFN